MIKWLDPLFVSESAERDIKRTVRRIKHRRGLLDIYVLVLPTNIEDQLDILHANYLLQPWYQHRELTIVGIAKGKREAVDLVVRMVDEAQKRIGVPNLKLYLRCLLSGEGGG